MSNPFLNDDKFLKSTVMTEEGNLLKARALPVGTVRDWKGKKYIKTATWGWILKKKGQDISKLEHRVVPGEKPSKDLKKKILGKLVKFPEKILGKSIFVKNISGTNISKDVKIRAGKETFKTKGILFQPASGGFYFLAKDKKGKSMLYKKIGKEYSSSFDDSPGVFDNKGDLYFLNKHATGLRLKKDDTFYLSKRYEAYAKHLKISEKK